MGGTEGGEGVTARNITDAKVITDRHGQAGQGGRAGGRDGSLAVAGWWRGGQKCGAARRGSDPAARCDCVDRRLRHLRAPRMPSPSPPGHHPPARKQEGAPCGGYDDR